MDCICPKTYKLVAPVWSNHQPFNKQMSCSPSWATSARKRALHQLSLLDAASTVNNSISTAPAIGIRVGIDSRNVVVSLNHLLSLTAHYSQKESCRNRDKCANSSSAVTQFAPSFQWDWMICPCRVIVSFSVWWWQWGWNFSLRSLTI